MDNLKEQYILNLFTKTFNTKPDKITQLALSGSDRVYFRIFYDKNKTCIGAYNFDDKENTAFIEFTKSFIKDNINVPQLIAEDLKNKVYLLEDLGSTTLFDLLLKERKGESIPNNIAVYYKKSLSQLVDLQLAKAIDYKHCYPRESFDKQSMTWDLSYFKYYFLKLAKIPFNEQLLEDDFNKLSDYLLTANTDFFMFRDFQARNIMIKEEEVYFIDYQGGRRGALQYDLASILFNSKANLPISFREELYSHYLNELKKKINVDETKFESHFFGYALIRILQAMGAYGFRGFYERKLYFLNSIPFALINLKYIISKFEFLLELPELNKVINSILSNEDLKKYGELKESNKLQIKISSFSYKKGLPIDSTEHGGGYIFDCRGIHNPGRYDEYKKLTGRDKPVIEFLDKEQEMTDFITNVYSLADKHIQKYIERKFDYLTFNFGCTGGQHRSVYSAEHLFHYLNDKYDVELYLEHREQNINEDNL